MSAPAPAPTVLLFVAGILAAAAAYTAANGPSAADLPLVAVVDLPAASPSPIRDDAPAGPPAVDPANWIEREPGVRVATLIAGDGGRVEPGLRVVFDQAVFLPDGTSPYSTWTAPRPTAAEIGAGHVIPGLEKALVGARVGDRLAISLAPSMAWGSLGGPGIPANTEVTLVVHVRAVGARRQAPGSPPQIAPDRLTPLEDGVRVLDLAPGSGVAAGPGLTAVVEMTLWAADGRLIESSLTRGRPARLPLGQRRVLPAIEAVLIGMKAGGRRVAVIDASRVADPTADTRLPTDGPLTADLTVVEVVAEPSP